MTGEAVQPEQADEDPGATESRRDPALLAAQIDTFFTNSAAGILASVVVGGILVWVLWRGPDHAALIAWYGAMLVLQAVRWGLRGHWRRHKDRLPADRWHAIAMLSLGLNAALFGIAGSLFFVGPDLGKALLIMTVAMMNAGAIVIAAALPVGVILFGLISLVPLAIRLLTMPGGLWPPLGLGIFVFLGVILFAGIMLTRQLRDALQLRLNNASLVATLQEQTALLERSVERAEAASHAKSEFLATVSHEIRTPINAVLGGIEILSSTPLDDRQAQCVRVVDQAGLSLLSLLDDILDISRIEAGSLTLEEVDFGLPERLRQVAEIMTPRAAAKGLFIELDIGAGLPERVVGDPARLRQILLNLLNNAVKFTLRGGVTLSARLLDSSPTEATVAFQVADTGIGIAPEHRSEIFAAFRQADGSISRRFGGAGLGLAIVQRLVDAMRGSIRLDSEAGKGSTFTVELKFAISRSEQSADTATARPTWSRRPTLMLVEDEPVNQFVAAQILERYGFEVRSASSGPEALAMLVTEPVELVLMDLGMPGMDGFEAARRIHELPGMAKLPILALTANVLPETIARCREVGMQGFLSKPIRVDVVLRTIADILPPDGAEADDVPTADLAHLEGIRRDLGDDVADALADSGQRSLSACATALAAAHEREDRRGVEETAHRMVSALQVLGFAAETEAARALEAAAREGRPLAAEVKACSQAVRGALAALAVHSQPAIRKAQRRA